MVVVRKVAVGRHVLFYFDFFNIYPISTSVLTRPLFKMISFLHELSWSQKQIFRVVVCSRQKHRKLAFSTKS